jgi:hypothetical protein
VVSRVLQAQYLSTVLCKGNQYLSAVLVKYPGGERSVAPNSISPCLLPAPKCQVVGRDSSIASLVQRLPLQRDSSPPLCIEAPGGYGKSVVALEVARKLHQPGCLPGGDYWVDLRGVKCAQDLEGRMVAAAREALQVDLRSGASAGRPT